MSLCDIFLSVQFLHLEALDEYTITKCSLED